MKPELKNVEKTTPEKEWQTPSVEIIAQNTIETGLNVYLHERSVPHSVKFFFIS